MVNRPFRVAFWALAVNVGLSLCWLLSDPESARLALQASPAPRPGTESIEPQPVLMAHSTDRPDAVATPAAATSPDAGTLATSAQIARPGERVPGIEPTTGTPFESPAGGGGGTRPPAISRVVPETPPLPIREVSSLNEEGYPWALHDASRTPFGARTFEELPPPPEFSGETGSATAAARSTDVDHETTARLAGLGVRLDSLHDKLADLRTSQATVERTLTDLAALSESAATVTHAVASPLEIRAVVIEAPRTGELRDGVLPALRLSGEAGAISGEDESWRDIAWGVSRSGAGVVSSWLQNRAATGRMAQRTIRLSPGATVALDLWRLLPPRMVQARGSHVFELAPRPGWGGGLELRCPESGSGEIQIEFRTADGSGSGRAASSDWQRTTIPEGGTLIITGRRDAGAHPGAEAGGGPSPHEQAVGRSEFVVILSPRRPERVDETVPEPARLLPMIDAPELPASGE